MFFLFGKRAKTNMVPGGRRASLRCPSCEVVRRFVEVERETTYTAYVAIDLLSSKDRAFACESCGELVDTIDEPPVAARDPEALRRSREADAKQRAAEKAQRDREVDDELAALKKKLGR